MLYILYLRSPIPPNPLISQPHLLTRLHRFQSTQPLRLPTGGDPDNPRHAGTPVRGAGSIGRAGAVAVTAAGESRGGAVGS
jgi:hypothetical protein